MAFKLRKGYIVIPGTEEKLKILGKGAKFDVSGFPRIFPPKKFQRFGFIYPAVGKGRCIRLFKVLQTNRCEGNCFYCSNRRDRSFREIEFSPEELASLFMRYFRSRMVEGFFLSSSIKGSPTLSEEKMLKTVEILRRKYGYKGYIHFKVLPGVEEDLLREAIKWVDRLSINLEAPGPKWLKKLSPTKDFFSQLWKGLTLISQLNRENPLQAGITTQFVVGVAEERDKDLLSLTYKLYKELGLWRVYYSAFMPIKDTPLENKPPCSPLREYRLYQADFLLRGYGFTPAELPFRANGNLPLERDPKMEWALLHPERFPVEINRADFEELIRVPGIGKISAQRILKRRREKKLIHLEDLKGTGARISRARNFITLGGKFYPQKGKGREKESQLLFLWEEL